MGVTGGQLYSTWHVGTPCILHTDCTLCTLKSEEDEDEDEEEEQAGGGDCSLGRGGGFPSNCEKLREIRPGNLRKFAEDIAVICGKMRYHKQPSLTLKEQQGMCASWTIQSRLE